MIPLPGNCSFHWEPYFGWTYKLLSDLTGYKDPSVWSCLRVVCSVVVTSMVATAGLLEIRISLYMCLNQSTVQYLRYSTYWEPSPNRCLTYSLAHPPSFCLHATDFHRFIYPPGRLWCTLALNNSVLIWTPKKNYYSMNLNKSQFEPPDSMWQSRHATRNF